MKKALIILILLSILLAFGSYGLLFYQNNRKVAWPENAKIQASLQAATRWMDANREEVLKHDNPVLWWMIQQSALRSQDPVLTQLFDRYRETRLETGRNLWLPLFYPGRWVPFKAEDLTGYPYYNYQFIYAISCDTELAELPLVQAQLDPDFCDRHPLRPACVTHQLMGFRFMQQNGCGDPEATQVAVSALQQRITKQLTWDIRVVDVYLQRVLMLVESGAQSAVQPIWLQQVLDAQRPDGGWSGLDPIVTLPGGKTLGFSGQGVSVGQPNSNFHATAQGVLLMTLLVFPEASP